MIRFKDIHIPKPCSIDYDLLPGNEVKRFCGSCKKHVHDFRGKNEAYLNEIFQTTGKVCGIYYADQIQENSLRKQRPYYYTIATKLISIALFIKSLLNPQYSAAFILEVPPITQKSIDSSEIKVHYKEKNIRHNNHRIKIHVNEQLYEYELKREDSIIYLPNNIQQNDDIKIIVQKSKRKLNYSVVKTKKREYSFKYDHSKVITIDISCKRKVILFKKKRPQVVGKLIGF